ncbi:PP2C family protein-serine/threonine phosphatase [Capsulimonas corticalis]|uniref:PP2C family protein-serine/threonine phosphatase n=1 Tax=Capsulimonas corticalis TaxID=2219043 RepID=UPI001401C21D|nr:SpoIIE family protein phosphatase [Capsulimonas corticalis]
MLALRRDLRHNVKGKCSPVTNDPYATTFRGQTSSSKSIPLPAEDRLRLIEANVRDCAIIIMDINGAIVNWNLGAECIMGWSEEEVLGLYAEIYFTTEDRLQRVCARGLARAALKAECEDNRWHVRKDGSRFWGSGTIHSLRERDGRLRGFVEIMHDTSEHKRAETELAAALGRERRNAEILQRSILLGNPRRIHAGLELTAQYEPASADLLVGGDFFDMFPLSDGRVAIVLGDVVGKGLEAAVHTTQIKFALRAFMREHAKPEVAVKCLNEFLCESERLDAERGASEDRLTRFAVLSTAVIDPVTGETSFAGGGAEPPIILTRSGKSQQIDLGGMPLGVIPETDYEATKVHLSGGDLIVLATDGLTESRRGNNFLGSDGLTRLAQDALSLGAVDHIAQAVLEGARAYGGAFRDDVCLLIARLS